MISSMWRSSLAYETRPAAVSMFEVHRLRPQKMDQGTVPSFGPEMLLAKLIMDMEADDASWPVKQPERLTGGAAPMLMPHVAGRHTAACSGLPHQPRPDGAEGTNTASNNGGSNFGGGAGPGGAAQQHGMSGAWTVRPRTLPFRLAQQSREVQADVAAVPHSQQQQQQPAAGVRETSAHMRPGSMTMLPEQMQMQAAHRRQQQLHMAQTAAAGQLMQGMPRPAAPLQPQQPAGGGWASVPRPPPLHHSAQQVMQPRPVIAPLQEPQRFAPLPVGAHQTPGMQLGGRPQMMPQGSSKPQMNQTMPTGLHSGAMWPSYYDGQLQPIGLAQTVSGPRPQPYGMQQQVWPATPAAPRPPPQGTQPMTRGPAPQPGAAVHTPRSSAPASGQQPRNPLSGAGPPTVQ